MMPITASVLMRLKDLSLGSSFHSRIVLSHDPMSEINTVTFGTGSHDRHTRGKQIRVSKAS